MTRLIAIRPLLALAAALVLGAGCPEIPTGLVDEDTAVNADADVFIPLSLSRIVDSVGDPAGQNRVAIYGAGFQPGATVFFGTRRGDNVLVLDDGQLNVNVPAREPGLVDVTVVLPDEQTETLTDAYLYRGPLEAISIAPTLGPKRGGVDITVTGAGFDADTHVFVGNRALEALQILDGRTAIGRLPARLLDEGAVVDVTVTNGFEQRVLSRAFRYVDPIEIDWLSPASGPTQGGTLVTVRGRGLDADSVVRVDGKATETVTPADRGAMIVRVPPGDIGPADLTITNAMEQTTLTGAFTYMAPTPPEELTLYGAWPNEGSPEGGLQVALTITGLRGGTVVTFNDEPATIIELRPSESALIVATPAGVAGPATLKVTSDGATATRSDLFRYTRRLDAGRVEPPAGDVHGGEEVVVHGHGFTDATRVWFGGAEAPVIDVKLGELTVRSPAGSPGRVDVTVVDGELTRRIHAGYHYRTGGSPRLLAVTPGQGSQAGGRIVRLLGEGLANGFAPPSIGRQGTDDFVVIDDALAVARAPRGDVGRVNVDAGRAGLLAMAYRYFNPAQRFGGTAAGTIPEALNVTVLEFSSSRPIADAYVILWDDLGTPYQGLTDDRGQITFSDVAFGPNQMVTAGKDNHTTDSVVDFDARDVTLLLIPLVSSPPGNGGGGGPRILEGSVLTGQVTGMDKQVVLPPGNCDNKLASGVASGTLCQTCEVDADCAGADARCTSLREQGLRCTVGCATDTDCPTGFFCKGVAHGVVQCLPAPGEPAAQCSVTQPDVFVTPDPRDSLAITDDSLVYELPSRPGEYAVVCLGGYIDADTDEFIALMMGVRRHVFALPGDTLAEQDVHLDIPLSRTLRIRLDEAPLNDWATELHTVDVYLDLGADGVFHMPSQGRALKQNLFELESFPAVFAESIYDGSYTFYATAVPDKEDEDQLGDGSFTLHQDITEIDDDAIFDVVPDGVARRQTHVPHDLHALTGAGPDRMLAVGDGGRILTFDGTFWAIQQAPTNESLRGAWATDADAWVVGDAGTVFRRDRLTWAPVAMPEALSMVGWAGITAVGEERWLWGDAGVWRRDASGSTSQVILDVTTGSIGDVWSDQNASAWIVGDGGMIRRWSGGPVSTWDVSGPSFRAVHGTGAGDIWAVGDAGRIAHWDGAVWFDFLPVTTRTLHAVHAISADRVWAVGDAGVILTWDGERWTQHAEVAHADLRGIWATEDGVTQAVGLHTVVLGPFLRVPRARNPLIDQPLEDLTLRWTLADGPEATLTWIELQHSSGFPYWTIVSDGKRQDIPLPDLKAAWGLRPLWAGQGFLQLARVYSPNFSIDSYNATMLTEYEWQSWSLTGFPYIVEDAE